MARCGCNTAQSTTCEAIMACIAANLGAGLDFNEVTRQLELRISTDAGNVAQIGSDGGFYSPAGAAPGPMTWPKTVATLPAQAIAATGGSNLPLPSTSPRAIEYAIAQNLDIYTIAAYNLADKVSFESVGALQQTIGTYTDNPSSIAYRHVGSVNVPSLVYDAGTRVNPTGRHTGAPVEFLEPDGGWAGFYNQPYGTRTISELLRIVRGRIVLALHSQRLELTEAEAEAGLRSVVAAVVAAGAQPWVIIYVPGQLNDDSRAPIAQWVPIVTGAGITAGVSLSAEHNIVGPPWTPAELVASGATWVEVRGPSHPDGVTDARITELVNGGLNVSVFTDDGRQHWTQHAFGLGARAIRSSDGVYARGGRGQPGDLAYRQNLIPGLATRTAVNGGMTPLTSTATAVFDAGFARQDEPGRWFPEQYAWSSGTGRFFNHQLLGTICPIPNTTDYRLTVRVQRYSALTTSTFRWAGVFVACPDDRDVSQVEGQANNPIRNGYNCAVWVPGSPGRNMGIFRWDDGVSTTLAETTAGPGWAFREWVTLTITVQADTITFQAESSTSSATVSAVDLTHRGPYAFYVWRDSTAQFIHGYDNPVDLVMYEPLT